MEGCTEKRHWILESFYRIEWDGIIIRYRGDPLEEQFDALLPIKPIDKSRQIVCIHAVRMMFQWTI